MDSSSSSEIMSDSVYESNFSSEIDTNKTIGDDKGNKSESEKGVGKLKIIVLVLAISLVTALVLVAFLSLTLVYVLSKPEVNTLIDEENHSKSRKSYQYHIIHLDDDESTVVGTVSLPKRLEEPMNIYSKELGQTFLVMGDDPTMKAFKITTEVYCCPGEERKRRTGYKHVPDEITSECKWMETTRDVWAGMNPEHAIDEYFEYAYVDFGDPRTSAVECHPSEGWYISIGPSTAVPTEGKVEFECVGICIENPEFSDFVDRNVGLLRPEDFGEDFIRRVFDKAATDCGTYSTTQIITEVDSMDMVEKKFGQSFSSFCRQLAKDVHIEGTDKDVNDLPLLPGKLTHVCYPGPKSCEYGRLFSANELPDDIDHSIFYPEDEKDEYYPY